MPKLMVCSSKDIIKFLILHGFKLIHQRGSHIKLQREGVLGVETMIVPERSEIAIGTMKSILNQMAQYISKDDIAKEFYR